MIVVESVSKMFKQGRKTVTALQSINLSINRGEIYGLIGANGSGKTTLAKILATLLLPDEGKVFIKDISVIHKPEIVKQFFGLSLGEGRSFYYRLTAIQNLEFFGTMLEIPPKQLKNRINELLTLFNLEDSCDKAFMKFSYGMKRKLDLARAMLAKPEVYILDEPTNGIDPFHQEIIRNTIYKLKQEGKTIFMITHNLHEASLLCDRVGIVDKGHLLWQGSVQDFVSEKEIHILSITSDREPTNQEKSTILQYLNVKKITPTETKTNGSPVSWSIYFLKEIKSLSLLLHILSNFSLEIIDIHIVTPSVIDIYRQFIKKDSIENTV